jgi:hypothetical protein
MLSAFVLIQSAVMLGLLVMYILTPTRVPFPFTFLVAMTGVLISAVVLASLSR